MASDEHIRIYEDVINQAACEALLGFLRTAPLSPAKAENAPADHKRFDELFVNDFVDEADWAAVNNRLFEIFNGALSNYVERFPQLAPHRLDGEGFRFKHYRRGHGQFRAHIDQTADSPGRVLAAILYLNDVEKGGETEFPAQGVRVAPRAGRLLIAPTAFTHPHQGNPPLSGDKFVVNTFAGFYPNR